ncbi:MBL fold metallo-hydrolase [Victivallis sp.]|uniref:MBL fold metallo-hydrolase n=1 Tax=Victivallis sp. TaxID=2049020 RepID=UPI003A91F975
MNHIKPFKICGNIYFVGTEPASSHLIATEEGLILLDSGYPQTLHHVIESIWELGFDSREIRCVIHSHGHYDHLGATRALLELADAETFLGAEDVDYANGTLDLTWAKELGYVYKEAFEPDHALRDGDRIRLGTTEILCLATPGHTPGTMSFFFDTEENGVRYRAGMHGGVGVNSMTAEFLNRYHLPFDCREKFFAGLERLKREHVDVPLGNHVHCNDTLGKAARIGSGAGNPFIAPGEWIPFLETCAERLQRQIEAERRR